MITQKQLLTQWVQRLESGLDRQTIGVLRRIVGNGESFCCLGVLCEVAVEHGLLERNSEEYIPTKLLLDLVVDQVDDPDDAALGNDTELPLALAEWLGVPANPGLDGNSAVQRNDNFGEDFETIAAAARREFGIED